MKKNDLVKFAVVGVAAGFCISGQFAREDNREIALSKCSKPQTLSDDTDMDGSQNMQSDNGQGVQNRQPDMKVPQGAAKRAMHYETSSNDENRKSAARKILDGED